MRVAHHAVVSAWRERERLLRARGAHIELFSARRWNEGGREVEIDRGSDTFVHAVNTIGTHPNAFLYSPWPLWRALAARPELIDLHEEPFALATAEMLLLRFLTRSKAPFLVYSAQNIEKRYPVPFRWFESYALRHAAGAYVCNERAGEILRRKGMRGPVELIPLGVDVDRFTAPDRAGPGPSPVVGYVGRLEPHKGVSVLLRAAAANPSWILRITGDGSQRPALEALVAELGLADRVSFLGFADGAELAARYRELDVVAVPSIAWPGWLEQFCRVAVEAMASGVPIVASRSGAIPDVVSNAGILVEPGDPDDLSRGIREALETDRWEQLRERGLTRSRDYTWDRVADQHMELYRVALPPRAAAAPTTTATAAAIPQVLVIAYGSPDMLRDAIDTLGAGWEVTIVDNSSDQETRSLAQYLGAHYIDPGANLGFGAGVNVGLRSLAERGLSDADVLLLNPDARIGGDEVRTMHRLLSGDPKLGAVGATQTDPATGAPVRVWWPFPNPARAWAEAVGLGALNRAHGFAIGSILLLRAEAIADVGMFDERFFLYAEEVDWQKRATDRGWRIGVADVTASHVGGGTSSDSEQRELWFHASAERYERKHFGVLGWQMFRAAMVAGGAARSLVFRGDRRMAVLARTRLFARGPVAELERRTPNER